jgi:6-phosphogluconolactonase (cycloisomerase 2 family)
MGPRFAQETVNRKDTTMRTLTTTCLGLLLVTLVSGCGSDGKRRRGAAATTSGTTAGSTSGTTAPTTSTPPAQTPPAQTPGLPPRLISLATPPSPSGGYVALDYQLIDEDSDPVDLVVEYSIDAGLSWSPASDAGAQNGSDGATALTSQPAAGIAHTFVWDSRVDAGSNLLPFTQVRLTPSDKDGAGPAETTRTFTLDSTAPASHLYSLVIPTDPQGPDSVNAYQVSSLGALTQLPGSPTQSNGQGRQFSSASDIVRSPRGDLLFASHNESAQIDVFRVDAAGGLSLVPGSPFATSGDPTTLALHPSGRFLYALNGTDLEAFAVDLTTGALAPLPGSPFQIGSSPRDLVVHPRGDALYTGHMFGADTGVRVHALDAATGVPSFASALDLSTLGSRPGKHLTIDPFGVRLFCSDLDAGVFVLNIDPVTRGLSLTASAPQALGGFLNGLTTTTRAGYLYASLSSGLHAYRVEPTGALTVVPGSPFANIGGSTLYLRTDTADAFLFASSRVDDTLRSYAIDPQSGVVSEVAGSPRGNTNPAGVVGPVLPR